ncbi:TorF family putative porin [Rhodomicrobium sp. Az07]|uniref:TorF family putative porin n=1 Tax=Rhodomicrobium sp. Az07 TaxID=2839034 RepID=UPI001BE5DB53|nr:TorF family putative porin [Rhodomicrobium sp. Az07]MBT3071886.1 TorF family putative porin [Rhodomicrobium sp. Az07]
MSADLYSGGLKDGPMEVNPFTWSVWAGGTSDYIFRGISQTRRDGTLQGGADASYGIFYVGTALSGVNFDSPSSAPANQVDTHLEIDVYGGIKPVWNGITFDFGIISYNYPNQEAGPELNFVEFKAGASKTLFSDITGGLTFFYSPDYTGELGGALAIEGTLSKPIYTYSDVGFTLSGTLGHQMFEEDYATPTSKLNDYTYGNVGVTAAYKAFSLDLRYWNTTLEENEAPAGVDVFQAGSAFVATAKVTY